MAENNGQSNMTTTVEERELVLERTFNAPHEQVFQAFTEPESLTKWWGAKGWTTTIYKMEVKPGGEWHYCMRGPAGEESWGKAIYHEVVPAERLVYTDNFADAQGNIIQGMPEIKATINFVDFEGKTRLMARAQFTSTADLESMLSKGMVQDITDRWDRLDAYLAGVIA